MIVEPFANDRVEDNLNPIGRVYYAASTMICVPASLASNGPALGAQAGEARLRDVVIQGGFTRFHRTTQDAVQFGVGRPTVRPLWPSSGPFPACTLARPTA